MVAMLLAFSILAGSEPGSTAVEPLSIQPTQLATLPRAEIKVVSDGQTTTYAGVPLAAILATRAQPIEGMPGLRDLADSVLLVRGADGYQAAVAAAAVAMDPKGERYLLATSRDGQSRSLQVVIPGDPKRARWVRDVVSIRLVRLGQVIKTEP